MTKANTQLEIAEHKQTENFMCIQRDLGIVLSGVNNLQKALALVVGAVICLEEPDSGGIYLIDPLAKAADLMYSKGLSKRFIKQVSHYDKGSDNVRLIMKGKPIFIEDSKFKIPRTDVERREGLQAHAYIPMLHQGQVIACMNIASHNYKSYSNLTQYFLQAIASQAGSAIARLLTEEALRNALTEVQELKNRLEAENIYLQDEIKVEHNFEEIICQSKEFKKILNKVKHVAATDSTVLIIGETGTGKELLARAIHNLGDRRDRPLVKINCAALPASLIESELFGHEEGAFTGATTCKLGRFELADGGTIFLDEIGDLPLGLQTVLLRILQEGEFERLGSSQTIKVDVRVIAATNRNLEKIVEEGLFREDLYYRLNVFPIKSPPLRDRKDDIPLLVNHFIKKHSAKVGKKIENIPRNVMDTLQAYHWPGNVRELENIVERAVVLSDSSILRLDGLSASFSNSLKKGVGSLTLKESERSFILKILEETNWTIQGKHGAAARLGIAPSSLRDRIKKHGLKRPL